MTKHLFGDLHKALLNNPLVRQQQLHAESSPHDIFHTYTITEDADVYTTKIYDHIHSLIFGKEKPAEISISEEEEGIVFAWIDFTTFTLVCDRSFTYIFYDPPYPPAGYAIITYDFVRLHDFHTYIFGYFYKNMFTPVAIFSEGIKGDKTGTYNDTEVGEFGDSRDCIFNPVGFAYELKPIVLPYFYKVCRDHLCGVTFDKTNPYKALITLKLYCYTRHYVPSLYLYCPITICSVNNIRKFNLDINLFHPTPCSDDYALYLGMYSFIPPFNLFYSLYGDKYFGFNCMEVYFPGTSQISSVLYHPVSAWWTDSKVSITGIVPKYLFPLRHSYIFTIDGIYENDNPTSIPAPELDDLYPVTPYDPPRIPHYGRTIMRFDGMEFGFCRVSDSVYDYLHLVSPYNSNFPLNEYSYYIGDTLVVETEYLGVMRTGALYHHFIYPSVNHFRASYFPYIICNLVGNRTTIEAIEAVPDSFIEYALSNLKLCTSAGFIKKGDYVIVYDENDPLYDTPYFLGGSTGGIYNYVWNLGIQTFPIIAYFFSCDDTLKFFIESVLLVPKEVDALVPYFTYYYISETIPVTPVLTINDIHLPLLEAWNRGKRFSLYPIDYRTVLKNNISFYLGFYKVLFGESPNEEDYTFIPNSTIGDFHCSHPYFESFITSYTFLNGIYLLGSKGPDYVHFFDHPEYDINDYL